MGKILLTGFEPFDGESVNPSQKLVEALAADPFWRDRVVAKILPVSFDRAFPALRESLVSGRDISFVLMFGLAGGRAKVSLERVVLNWVEARTADEDGMRPATGRLRSDADAAIFSRLPLDMWRDRIEAAGVSCEVSLTAGGFVCNQVAFQVADLLRSSQIESLFVHVPLLPEQAREGKPTMDFDRMLAAVKILLEEIAAVSKAAPVSS